MLLELAFSSFRWFRHHFTVIAFAGLCSMLIGRLEGCMSWRCSMRSTSSTHSTKCTNKTLVARMRGVNGALTDLLLPSHCSHPTSQSESQSQRHQSEPGAPLRSLPSSTSQRPPTSKAMPPRKVFAFVSAEARLTNNQVCRPSASPHSPRACACSTEHAIDTRVPTRSAARPIRKCRLSQPAL